MNVLITGGNGYIGRSLYEGLRNQHTVTKIGRKEMDLIHGGSVKRFFKDKHFDVLIHCAVVGGHRLREDSWKVCDENLTMYYNLLQCRDCYGKMIHFGSGAELYATDKPYGFSKSVISNSMKYKEGFYNIRIFGVFDENELDTRFIKANIKRYLSNESMVIHKNRKMDMFYMQDLVTLVNYYIHDEDLPKEIDCTYQQTKTLVEIADIINQLSDYKSEIILQSRENEDAYKGKYIDLGLNFVGLEEGIKNVYEKLK